MTHTITLSIDPPRVTAQEKKVTIIAGKPRFYEPKRLKQAKKLLTAAIMPQVPEKTLAGPLKLRVHWKFEAKTHKPGTWKISRPDTDNLDKMLKDVMTACGVWTDDAVVVHEEILKTWEKTPGIDIEISTLPDTLNHKEGE